MKRTLWPAQIALAVLTCTGSSPGAISRIKDLASVEGIRQNQLIGYAPATLGVLDADCFHTLDLPYRYSHDGRRVDVTSGWSVGVRASRWRQWASQLD
jgi:hypothetical protein